ncbi:MAG: tRNA (adenosine(37)-N6)-dimethylallyltransferase MiaA [Chitinophagaceae bacterium]|nr:tRNA (adenosine(37)-N6)-dimethylallyltransferase MiaA [Chitinophagaceae bacterium]
MDKTSAPLGDRGIKTCIVIVGPTAVGKTSLAIEVAQHFHTEIISADSRQCFRELNIGVAKPSAEELNLVKHYFISSHSIEADVNAAVFEQYALEKVNEIFRHHDVAVVVGGTGLYVKAFCQGIDEVPVIDPAIRKNIIVGYEAEGLEWLQKQVEKNDPVYYLNGEIKNPQRLMRALEVKLSTGRSIMLFQTQQKKKRNFNIIRIGLQLPKEQLNENINKRVDAMIQRGLLDEVKLLLPYQKLNALQTVGYRELFGYLEGPLSLDDAIGMIKLNTRQYAKRQMTWFRKDTEIKWCEPEIALVLAQINQFNIT